MRSVKRATMQWWQVIIGLVVVALIEFLGVAAPCVFAQETELPPPPWTKETSYLHATPEQKEAWERAWERLMQFRTDSSDAVEEQIKLHLDPVFSEAKPKIPAFAQEVLGMEGKFHHAVGTFEKFFSDTAYGIGQLFGTKPMYQPKDWADGFNKHASQRFVKMVLDPADITRAVSAAANGYLAKRKELENGLLVDLAADLPDGVLGPHPSPPDLTEELRTWATADTFTFGIGDDANVDAGALIGRIAVSSMLADKVTAKQKDGLAKLATNYAVGNEIENGLEGGMRFLGIDPAGKIAAKVALHLDTVHALFVGRTDNYSSAYDELILHSLTNPDEEVRSATGKAAHLIEKHAYLGLRPKLKAVQHQRTLTLRRAIYRLLLNADAPLEAFLRTKDDLPREAALAWAKEWILFHEDYAAFRKMKGGK